MKKKIIGVIIVGAVVAGAAAIAKKVFDSEEDDFGGCDGDCENCTSYCMCEFDDGECDNASIAEDDGPSDGTPAEKSEEE